MRTATLAVALLPSLLYAADPPLPTRYNPPPRQVLARATADDTGRVTLTVRDLVAVPVTEKFNVAVPVTVQRNVQGRTVTETRMVTETREMTVLKPVKWRLTPIKFDGVSGAMVFDTRGTKVEPNRLPQLLKDETPILVSATGLMVDPFYLKTVKEDTLVLVVPPGTLLAPGEEEPQPPSRAPAIP